MRTRPFFLYLMSTFAHFVCDSLIVVFFYYDWFRMGGQPEILDLARFQAVDQSSSISFVALYEHGIIDER